MKKRENWKVYWVGWKQKGYKVERTQQTERQIIQFIQSEYQKKRMKPNDQGL